MIDALRLLVTLYLAIGLCSVVLRDTWLEGIEAFLEEWHGPKNSFRFLFGAVFVFFGGMLLDVFLWPYNEWAIRRD